MGILVPLVAAALALAACGADGGEGDRAARPTSPSVVVDDHAPTRAAAPRTQAAIRIGGEPCAVIAYAGAIWVGEATRRQLVRVDPRTNRIVARVTTPAAPCALHGGAGAVWAADSALMGRVDARSNRVTGRMRAERGCGPPAVRAGEVWWATDADGNEVSVFDASTTLVAARMTGVGPTGVSPCGVAVASGRVWVAIEDGTLQPIDAAQRTLAHPIAVGPMPAFPVADGAAVWLANEGHGAFRRVDLQRGITTATYRVGGGPIALEGRRALWTVWYPVRYDPLLPGGREAKPLLWRVDVAAGRVTDRLRVGAGMPDGAERAPLAGVAVSHGSVWTANTSDGRLYRISLRR